MIYIFIHCKPIIFKLACKKKKKRINEYIYYIYFEDIYTKWK